MFSRPGAGRGRGKYYARSPPQPNRVNMQIRNKFSPPANTPAA